MVLSSLFHPTIVLGEKGLFVLLCAAVWDYVAPVVVSGCLEQLCRYFLFNLVLEKEPHHVNETVSSCVFFSMF